MSKFKHWSPEEIQAILPLINSNETVNNENTADFRAKYNRTLHSVLNFVYVRRRELSGKRKLKRKSSHYHMRKQIIKKNMESPLVNEVKPNTSEVKIPIKNMTISQDGNGLCLVVKF